MARFKKGEDNSPATKFKKGAKEPSDAGKIGGVKSGIARRARKEMKEALKALLSLDIKNEKIKSTMKALGVPDADLNNQQAMLVAVFNEALKGNVQAAAFIRDTIGEKPVEKTQSEINVPIQLINDGLD